MTLVNDTAGKNFGFCEDVESQQPQRWFHAGGLLMAALCREVADQLQRQARRNATKQMWVLHREDLRCSIKIRPAIMRIIIQIMGAVFHEHVAPDSVDC